MNDDTMTTHIKIRRVLERYRLGPKELGGVGVGELADLIEDALDLRARDEAIIKATMAHYLWENGRIPDGFVLPPEVAAAIIAAAEREEELDEELDQAIQWRDWQTVEMLMDEQETP